MIAAMNSGEPTMICSYRRRRCALRSRSRAMAVERKVKTIGSEARAVGPGARAVGPRARVIELGTPVAGLGGLGVVQEPEGSGRRRS